tara:strand:- start:16 stop:177 length:162 start_codon:yes stop_codon:yes gene_type:complete
VKLKKTKRPQSNVARKIKQGATKKSSTKKDCQTQVQHVQNIDANVKTFTTSFY